MTECERIIQQEILPEVFFRAEIVDGFEVAEQIKKVWAIEIDILLQLDKICKRHSLRYFLIFGSLLGAVRHNGYIPWDDDLDVCMPRKDYEEFIRVAQAELKMPYFLQIPETDPGYYYSFAKIRNTNTTFITEVFRYQRFNMGLLIDVFPLDVCDEREAEENYKMISRLNMENSTYMRMSHHNLSQKDKERVQNYKGGVPLDTYKEIQSIASKYENQSSKKDKRIIAVFTEYSYEKMVYDFEDVSETELHDFNGLRIPIPKGYDNILRTTYGDYMKLPPVKDRGIRHSEYIIDTDRSYRDYLSDNFRDGI